MAWSWTIDGTAGTGVNIAPATGSVTMFDIKAMLKQNGWVVKASGDATSLFSTTDGLTTSGSGAGGLGNANAWFRIQDPGTVREYTVQRNTNVQYRIKWSHSAKFTGGSQSATVTPSATDEQIIRGGGTDASPTWSTIFGTDGAYHLHCGGDTAAPYDWFYVCTASAGGAVNSHGWLLGLVNGSYPIADVAPYVLEFGDTGTVLATTLSNTKIGSGYYKKGLSGEAWVTFGAANYSGFANGAVIGIPSNMAVNPYSGNDGGAPIPVGRAAALASPGWKGFLPMTAIMWAMQSRSQFDTQDSTATAWAASTAYALDARVSNGGYIYLCIVAGTSAGSGGPTQTVGSQTDNTVTWQFLGPVMRHSIFADILLRTPTGVVLS